MTRIPRNTPDHPQANAGSFRDRLASRKALATGGAGLALAGLTAATVATVFSASAATIANSADQMNRPLLAATAMMALPARTVHADGARLSGAARGGAASADATRSGRGAASHAGHPVTRTVAKRTHPHARRGPLPPADRLAPAGSSGPQAWLPMTQARWHNATTIVRQALAAHMGLRSAVIAVATAMQESSLMNLGYGTSDSLGLFQQRPSMGWGTAQQVMNPAYSADAFLAALRAYQASDPGWVRQPLWRSAQGVQRSAFPYAYAKWQAQAANLVRSVADHTA